MVLDLILFLWGHVERLVLALSLALVAVVVGKAVVQDTLHEFRKDMPAE